MISIHIPTTGNVMVRFIQNCLPGLNLQTGPVVAGGCARLIYENAAEIGYSDVDVFFPTREGMQEYVEKLPSIIAKEHKAFGVQATVKFEDQNFRVQFIHIRPFNNVPDLLEDFDFTVAMFATDGQTIVMHEDAPRDIEEHMLRLPKPPRWPRPFRLTKYCAQGFLPAPGVISAIISANSANMQWFAENVNENMVAWNSIDDY
jgi:hypothetical protein